VVGEIRYGNITVLTGISVQDVFLWFAVRGIRVNVPSSGVIYFDIDIIFKHFPLSQPSQPLPPPARLLNLR
jgi:hypothetical protein